MSLVWCPGECYRQPGGEEGRPALRHRRRHAYQNAFDQARANLYAAQAALRAAGANTSAMKAGAAQSKVSYDMFVAQILRARRECQ